MNAFITGSQVYGKPSEKSDIDLVLQVDFPTRERLIKASDLGKEPVRFGNLNLILCTSDAEMAVWKVGTCSLYRKSRPENDPFTEVTEPYSSEEAKAEFDLLRGMVGIQDSGNDSGDD